MSLHDTEIYLTVQINHVILLLMQYLITQINGGEDKWDYS